MKRLTLIMWVVVVIEAVSALSAYWLVEQQPWIAYLSFFLLPILVGLMFGLWLGCRYREWLTHKIRQ